MKFSQGGIFETMDTPLINAQMSVEMILKKWPQTFSVFRSRKADCFGCLLQRFCTLQDVAETYNISLQEMLRDLETCVKEDYPTQRSNS